jgi:microcystin degradation protein MlrC
MSKKIALMGIYHESNTFVKNPTVLKDFQNGHYMKGEAIRSAYRAAHHEIGGMIEIMEQQEFDLVPILYAETTPGGIIASDTYSVLVEEMFSELHKALPVDGCLVVPHGAGVSQDFPDMDGDWLSRLRQLLGENIPIVGTLDLHANVSPLMAATTDALVPYRQNPHVDQRERGKEAAMLLVEMLQKKIRPRQVLIQTEVAISIEQQFTNNDPCKSLYAYSEELGKNKNILSVGILLGFPYADVREMGTSFLVISDGDPVLAEHIGKKLESFLIRNKASFVGNKNDIPTSLAMAKALEKPVLMLDMGDNIGGGSPGNSIMLLKALENDTSLSSFCCIFDPTAVNIASAYKVDDTFNLNIQGTVGEENVDYTLKVTLTQLNEGRFTEEQPRHGGQLHYDMGKTAVVRTEKGNTLMLTSLRVPPFSLRQLTTFDITPKDFDILVAKGVIAPIAAYAPVCPSTIQVNTPGVTQADMTLFNYKNRRRPLFPFEPVGG